MKKKGFTLIELLAVIVILAIIALIVTPVITGIIRSARDAADKRSAEAYVKAGENFFTSTLLSVENYALLGTNVIDKLDVSHNPATGSIIVDAEGNVEMAIVIRDKCYKKAKTASIGEITVDENIDNCTLGAVITYTPERCFEYELENNNATITGYLCGSTGSGSGWQNFYRIISNHDGEFNDVYIPPTLGGHKVISIGAEAFQGINDNVFIDSIVIPEGVTSIGNYAFAYNTLNKVVFPSTLLEIGLEAFDHNYLAGIDMKNGVRSIRNKAFSYNELTSVTIPSSVVSIGSDAFRENYDLTDIKIDNFPDAISGSPWGAYEATVTYLRDPININIDESLTDLYVDYSFSSNDTVLTFVSGSIFRTITSVTIDGEVYYENTYVVPSGTTDINVTAYTYDEVSTVTIETPHNYPNNLLYSGIQGVNVWSTVDEDAKSYTITFDEKSETESGKDYINIWKTNECVYKLSGKEMAGQTYTIEGSRLAIMLYSNEENNYYGFKATITKNT